MLWKELRGFLWKQSFGCQHSQSFQAVPAKLLNSQLLFLIGTVVVPFDTRCSKAAKKACQPLGVVKRDALNRSQTPVQH